jgi:hypothetical protein
LFKVLLTLVYIKKSIQNLVKVNILLIDYFQGISVTKFFGCKIIATMTSAMSTDITTHSIRSETESTQRVDETTNQTEKTTSNVDNTDEGLSSLTTTTEELRPIVSETTTQTKSIETTTIREKDFWSSWNIRSFSYLSAL